MTSSPRTASSPGGPAGRADEPGSDFSADYADLEASSPDDEGGNDDQIDLVDPAARVMEGASTYLTADEQDDLDEPLRSITAAIATLAQADPETLARAIDYDHRGVLEPIGDAVRNVTRMRVLVETSPWFLARLGI